MIQLTSTVSANSELLSTEIDGELVMMDMLHGHYIYLNQISSMIWRELQQPRRVAEVCATLEERYALPEGAGPDTIRHDVIDLLQQMADKRLIELHD